MDEFHDDNLKKVFSRLEGYESPQRGVSWMELKKYLGGDAGWSKAMVLSLGILLSVAPAGIVYQNQSDSISEDIQRSSVVPEVAPQPKAITPTLIASTSDADKYEVQEQLPAYSSMPKKVIDVEKLFGTATELIASTNNEPVSISQSDEEVKINDPEIVEELIEVDSSIVEDQFIPTDDSEHLRVHRFSVSLSPFYSFGIVKPLTTDTEVLSKYESRPGFGVKLDFSFLVLSTSTGVLELGPSYMFMKKSFDFKVFNYGPEAFNEVNSRMSLINHYAGLKVQYQLLNQKLSLGATLYKSFEKSNVLNNYLGNGLVLLNITRDIELKTPDISMYIRGSFGFPVLGEISTFRYNPIQFEVGLKKNFTF